MSIISVEAIDENNEIMKQQMKEKCKKQQKKSKQRQKGARGREAIVKA